MKREHPGKLIAMQVGDFFEFAGWDAVLVIEAIKMKGMGLSTPPMHALWARGGVHTQAHTAGCLIVAAL